MTYKIDYDIDVDKVFAKMPKRDVKAIKERIDDLAENPRPYGSTKLINRPGYRIRAGNYRIIYEILEDRLVVLVLNVDLRKDIYKYT